MINMVEETTVEETTVEEDSDEEDSVEETPVETFDVIYSCLRCATNVSNTELSRLPEIKCICGFRVFTKVRPPVVKTIKAI
jgi:DNA-directed RNA polymerase subunit P